MQAYAASPEITSADRLSVTTFFAVVAHLILILGITFVREELPERRVESLDVVLIPTRADTVPERADYWSQTNQDGGSDDAPKARPAPADAAPSAAREPDVAPTGATKPESATTATLTAPTAHASRTASATEPGAAIPATEANSNLSREIAVLSAELERKLRAYAERPRRRWISASTREHEFAAYMDAWRRRVERVGNLNYPEEAERRALSGDLLLEVALNPDGTVAEVALRRTSGEPILDAAAIRIVELAAPYAPFPEDIADKVDVLHIERTWIFHSGRRFSSPRRGIGAPGRASAGAPGEADFSPEPR